MSDLEVDSFALIEQVEERPCLWDRTLDEYRDKAITSAAWTEVCQALKEDYDTLGEDDKAVVCKIIQKKWINLRDNWTKAYKAYRRDMRAGAGQAMKRSRYFSKMSFMTKVLAKKKEEDGEDSSMSMPQFDQVDQNSHFFVMKREPSETDDEESYTPKKRKAMDQLDADSQASRHMSFFQSIVPSIVGFDEDQTLEFQMGVLQLIRSLRSLHN